MLNKLPIDDEQLAQGLKAEAEASVLDGMAIARDEVEQRRAADWPDEQTARERLSDLSPEQRRRQFENARETLVEDFADVIVTTNEFSLGTKSIQQVQAAYRDFLASIHNPLLRESLLLAAQEDYRDDVRELLAELAALVWGWYEAADASKGECARTYLEYAAPRWGTTLPDLWRRVFDERLPEDPQAVREAKRRRGG